MHSFAYFFHDYWLPACLLIGLAAAALLVHRNWDRIVIKGSGRK